MSKTPVGEVRPSQLLWTYGPGALIDLPNLSVLTMGTDAWSPERCETIQEARLLENVRRVLGPQVEALRLPPIQREEFLDPFSAEAYVGVPVKPFPRWLRCVKCGLLSPFDAELFEIKEDRFRPERTRFVHRGCRGSKGDKPPTDADAVPARFLVACKGGHLDDFPWGWYLHGGPSSCKGTLRFFESGASLQTENLWVKCDTCGAAKNMAQAFGKAGRENLPSCRGRHPHLDRFDPRGCDEELRTVLLGATNGWFPITLSVIAIPLGEKPIVQLIADNWIFFEDVESEKEAEKWLKKLIKTGQLPGLEVFDASQAWKAIQDFRSGASRLDFPQDLKEPEWEVFTRADPPTDYPHFMTKKVDTPKGFENEISRVLLLERMREVNALIGFTRVEPPDEGTAEHPVHRAPISSGSPRWVPATHVHGEGVFIQFDTGVLEAWSEKNPVKKIDEKLRLGYRGWQTKRKLDSNEGYPGIRYVMLHTLGHLLIRELALECGYSAASIRERIYADTEEGKDQAGILLYTAAADSDGTLGGLVELGKPEHLGRILRQALDRARVCASDPLCAEHDPGKDQSLHGAACHACSFVSETSCEKGNRFLDRSLVVPTLEIRGAAFFGG
ncbi:MAG: DrmB family protein [Synergistales bacterium]